LAPVIEIEDGEIDVVPGEFWDMRKEGLFVKEYVDENDSLKLVGVTQDGKVYVTEKQLEDMTDEELLES
jgi:hypothetical protein